MQQPRAIPLAPVPASIQVQQAQFPTGMQVLLIIQDCTGDKAVFISPDAAGKIAQNMLACSRAGNLIIPPGTRLPDPPEVDMNDEAVRQNQAAMREFHKRQQQEARDMARLEKLAKELEDRIEAEAAE